MKAVHRQRAVEIKSGQIKWESSLTVPNAPIDELLTHNWSVVSRTFDPVFEKATVLHAAE